MHINLHLLKKVISEILGNKAKFRSSVPPVDSTVLTISPRLRNVASSIKRKDSKEEAEAVIEAMDELSAYDARS